MFDRGLWRILRVLAAGALVSAMAGDLPAAKKKPNPDDITQILELPKDPPTVATGETRRLVFHVSPLSAKGLLSQQTRDAMRAVLKANGGMPVVHIRAFVGGSGDLRRVPQIVSEVLTEKKMPLPSVSVVQVGGLALEGAQVVLEAVSLAKKDVNPDGIGFLAGLTAAGETGRAALDKELESLRAKAGGAAVVRVSCYVSAGGGLSEMTTAVTSRFSGAAVNVVQTVRAPARTEATCEAVTRGGAVKSEKLAFTGTRIAIGSDEKAAAATFQRLDRDLAEAGAGPGSIIAMRIYPLTTRVGEMARSVRGPAGAITVVPFEGVASLDAVFAADAVAVVTRPSAP
jgi:enamine deaminase RidA (YjgF/YER057c/UK114 family)